MLNITNEHLENAEGVFLQGIVVPDWPCGPWIAPRYAGTTVTKRIAFPCSNAWILDSV